MSAMKHPWKIAIFLLISTLSLALSKQFWDFELIQVDYYTSNPEVADIKLNAQRIDRGRYGASGFIDLKIDLYEDDVRIQFLLQRSQFRSGPFTTMPMKIENETLSTAVNVFYRNMIMEEAQKCCENAPYFNDTFKPPLTKRLVTLNQCSVSLEKLPNYMMDGYYITRTSVYGRDWYGYLETLAYVESAN
ncbi:uncharacterized protein LOC133331612 [Musca vetustissima]|uniref:uncharacterized protein LOC133331612 n=1 Tax=Musca vetustissima TaxID=27455 RepID=UPI002AB76564|nr:uncharacterized protein LOC133331612 [Musca vetustissima]